MPTALPSELYRQLTHAFDQRAWLPAKELAARLLSIAPRHPVVNYIAGIACMEVRQFATALKHLHIATSMEPARADFAVHFAKALSLARRNVEAKVAADRARPLAVGDAAMLDTLGVIYTQLGEYTSAAWAFRAAVGLAPGHAPFRYNLSTSLIAAGDIDAAEIELEACLEVDPRHWLAHLTLAQLRRQTTAHNHVARLESLLQGIERVGASDEALMCLNMALAKEKKISQTTPMLSDTSFEARQRAQRNASIPSSETRRCSPRSPRRFPSRCHQQQAATAMNRSSSSVCRAPERPW